LKEKLHTTITALAAAALLAAAGNVGGAPAGDALAPSAGFPFANMDPAVRPQDDFYRFVNGGWLTRSEVPSDRPRWGAFDELRDHAEDDVLQIIEAAVAGRAGQADPDLAKVADLYLSVMDEAGIEAAGLAPVSAWLRRVDAIPDHATLAGMFGELVAQGVLDSTLLSLRVDLDFADTQRHAIYFGQAGLGMPDRDYYLLGSEPMAAARSAYRSYIARVLELAGADAAQAAQAATQVLALESELAKRQWTRAARRDRQLTYNPVAAAALADIAPGFDWPSFLAAAGIGGQQQVILREASYFPAMAELLAATPIETWRSYLRFRVLDQNAPQLTAALVAAHFDFHSRTISGIPDDQPRWKRGVTVVQSALGEAVGREYVRLHFSPESRARLTTMVANLKAAYAVSIDELDWMSDATKAEAQAKLASLGLKIGYPDEWRDYSALQISAGDLFGNVLRARRFEHERMIARLGKPVDPGEWFMTPQTVNAYYSPTRNEIVFPAAILQPPFFDPAADDAVNYGAIGAVIGHEISHGFDDQGRRTDGSGRIRDWWTAEDDARYRELAERLVAQYGAFEPIDGMNIDGRVSLGENIADLAGVTVAHRAYRLALEGESPQLIQGLTGDQRFFMGWAQIWRIQYRDDALRRQLVTGPHSPGRYRVVGVLRNIEPFYDAFDLAAGDGMWIPPEERIAIW
jgi:putative endopeptidase